MKMKFIKKDINKKSRLKKNWRKPKGITNKKRLNRKGHSANVRPGYGTKADERNKVNGLEIIRITRIEDFEKVNPKKQAVIIAKMGRKKKTIAIKKAEELKITIINLNKKKYEETTKKQEEKRKHEKKKLEEKTKKKEDVKKEKPKTEEKKEAEEATPEEKKKQEKEERDKIITKSK